MSRRPPLWIATDATPTSAAALPSRPGVLVFETEDHGVMQVLATGDLRAAAARRLTPDAGKADLSELATRLRACVCGSMAESELVYLEIARDLTPETYRAAADLWKGWFVRLDPEAELPVWARTDLTDLVGSAPAPATVLGPCGTKDSAKRLGQTLDDLFELCREPERLAQAPNATACMYKEMGQCPAACDGSEPIGALRDRARAAGRLIAGGPAEARGWFGERMRSAASAQDFEAAARWKAAGDSAGSIWTKAVWRHAASLDRFAVLLVLPAGRKGWARLIAHSGGQTAWLADTRADEPGLAAAEAAVAVWLGSSGGPFEVTGERAERIGLVCRRLFYPGRGAGKALSVGRWRAEGIDSAGLRRAVRAAAKVEAEPGEADHAGPESSGGPSPSGDPE